MGGKSSKKDQMSILSKSELENLGEAEKHFIRKIEEENLARAMAVKKRKLKGRWIGLSVTAGVFAIYFYTIHAIKQESFLDFVEDETPNKKTAA